MIAGKNEPIRYAHTHPAVPGSSRPNRPLMRHVNTRERLGGLLKFYHRVAA